MECQFRSIGCDKCPTLVGDDNKGVCQGRGDMRNLFAPLNFAVNLTLVSLFKVLNLLFTIIVFVYFWPCWVFVAGLLSSCRERGLLALWCAGFPLRWFLLLQIVGSWACRLPWLQHMGSVVVAPRFQSTGSLAVGQGLSCSATFGVFLDQGANPMSPALAGRLFTTEPPGKP